MAWSPALCTLFDQIKLDLTSDPCLARACSSIPVFLKTDWSSAGMGWILMQPHDSPESQAALAALRKGDSALCDFDLNLNGPTFDPMLLVLAALPSLNPVTILRLAKLALVILLLVRIVDISGVATSTGSRTKTLLRLCSIILALRGSSASGVRNCSVIISLSFTAPVA